MKDQFVKDWMSPEPVIIAPNQSLPEAHALMKESQVRRLPVVDAGKLVGIISLSDVLEAEPSNANSLSIFELNYLLARLSVAEIMTKHPISVGPMTPLAEAAQIMLQKKIGGLPVVDNNMLVGIITESDIFRALVRLMEASPVA